MNSEERITKSEEMRNRRRDEYCWFPGISKPAMSGSCLYSFPITSAAYVFVTKRRNKFTVEFLLFLDSRL